MNDEDVIYKLSLTPNEVIALHRLLNNDYIYEYNREELEKIKSKLQEQRKIFS